ncbi:MAG: hypothetical protein KY466_15110 [Gemmatimonadetes bacterium]|nr:hypothetical protein [Gemmatimonadota bacterium]
MEPLILFGVMVLAVVALAVHNARRNTARARELFTPLAAELGGRVTAPKLGTPSLRFAVPGGEAKMSLLRQKGTEVTIRHLRLRLPAAVPEEEVTRIRTRPTRVVHTRGEVLEGGTGLPDRWRIQSTHPSEARSLIDGEVRRLLSDVEEHRRVAVEIRNGRITIRWGEPVDAPAARRLLELGRAVRESLERQARRPA